MKRLVLLVIVAMILSVLPTISVAADSDRGPKMVVMPVQVDSDYPEIRQEMEYLSFKALKEMNYDIITGYKVVNSFKKIGFSLTNYSSADQGTKKVLSDENTSKAAFSKSVLDRDALIKVGRYFRADYAAGVTFKCWNKTTTQLIQGKRNNGRAIACLTIVDVNKGEIIYQAQTAEVGDADKNKVAVPLQISGLLAATGIIGRGRTTRTAGWMAMAAPQFIKAGDKTGETLQYNSGLKAAQMIFNDFASYRDR